MSSYHLDHLEYLEAEAIHVLREVSAGSVSYTHLTLPTNREV